MAEKKGMSKIKKFIALLFFVIFIVFGIITTFYVKDNYFPNKDIGNQTNMSVNNSTTTIIKVDKVENVYPEKKGFWNFAIVLIIIIGTVFILGMIIWALLRYFKKNPFTKSNKKTCIKKALETLKEQGYEIGHDQPKQGIPFYGGGEEKYPAWAFIFVKERQYFFESIGTIEKHKLVSCKVNAKTLEVFDEDDCKNKEDILEELNNQWFGKVGVPNFPVKPEKKPSMTDLFGSSKPNISMNIPQDQINEDDGE